MKGDVLLPTDKNYLDLPSEDVQKQINKVDRRVSLKQTTKEFEHFVAPGEKPDLRDILTNPKYGNHKRTNVIVEHSSGTPENTVTHAPVVNHVTEEWVDERNHASRHKPKDVDYTLSLSNSDLQSLPALFNKDFSTPDAEIHLTVDKTALESSKPATALVKKDQTKDEERRLGLDPANPGFYNQDENDDWSKAFGSFGNASQLLDQDFSKLDPKSSEMRDLAPSSFSANLDSFTGNPSSDQLDLLGGVSEDDLLDKFIRSNAKGFQGDNQDKDAFQKFEEQMSTTGKQARRVPILI